MESASLSHVLVPKILQSLHHHTCHDKHTHTHTHTANPPLLLTNERIITFADMWRGGGEAEEGGTVHFSKQEMNSPCCGHLSPGRGGRLVAQSPCYPLKPDTPVELTPPPGHRLRPAVASTLSLKPIAMEERATKMYHSCVFKRTPLYSPCVCFIFF